MTEPKSLELHFLKRYQEYLIHTQDILTQIPNVLEAITRTLVDEQYTTLQWEDAQYSADDGILILIGNVKVEIGDDIQLDDGRKVAVTEENVSTLRRIVRVGIPMDLAEHGSVEDIQDYLANKQHKNYTPLDAEGEPQTVDDLMSEDQVTEYYNKILKEDVEEVFGFDSEDLTDDQVQQLLLIDKSEKQH